MVSYIDGGMTVNEYRSLKQYDQKCYGIDNLKKNKYTFIYKIHYILLILLIIYIIISNINSFLLLCNLNIGTPLINTISFILGLYISLIIISFIYKNTIGRIYPDIYKSIICSSDFNNISKNIKNMFLSF